MMSELLSQLLPDKQAETLNENELVSLIERRVEELLRTDPGALLQFLYRLDVAEDRVKQALAAEAPAHALAKAIIAREIHRQETRKKYSRPTE
jgi:hypothetical protein